MKRMDDRAVLAVDLGGTNVKTAIVDREGRVVAEDRFPTRADRGPGPVCASLVEALRTLARDSGRDVRDFPAVGLGLPGPLDAAEGVVLHCPNLPGWERFPVSATLAKELGLPVHIENDANAAALAEAWMGAGRDCAHVVCLTLGTGVGSGIVSGGSILKGQGQGAELGHMIVREGGRLCGCGARGCLEAYASASAVADRAREAIELGGPAVRRSKLNDGDITCKAVFEAAEEGDDMALRVVSDTGRFLAAGLASVIHIFHPEVIVLTGGMIRAGEQALLGPTRKFLQALTLPGMLDTVRIELSPLEDRAGVLGAAAVAFGGLGEPVVSVA